MPSRTTTRPTRTPGVVFRSTYQWSECQNYDHGFSDVACTRCGAVLTHSEDDWDFEPGEIEALEFVHSMGLCLISAGVRAVAAAKARADRLAASADEPF